MVVLARIKEDVASVLLRDPAARSPLEVVVCYAGLHALWSHRVNHWLWNHRLPLLARWLSQLARILTGIEIHPGATIGRRLFIDHGMSVVIGETAVLGDDILMYQGVTLGGTGKDKVKRHPTIGNRVVIGSGAKVLGNILIGDDSRIGAGSVVLRDVPDHSTVVGVPGHVVLRNGKRLVVSDPNRISDPISDALTAMANQLKELQQKVQTLAGNDALEVNAMDSLQSIIEIDYQI